MKKILLDAGHGGKDPGAVSHGTNEKDLTLTVVLGVRDVLRGMGYPVLCTRDHDEFLSPGDRAKMINDYKPDAFVSIHCNASDNPNAHGIETFYRDERDEPLANAIHFAIVEGEGLDDRGVKSDIKDLGRRLAVLNNRDIPACLCEIGFITNDEDLEVINNGTLVATSVALGVMQWSESA